MFKNSILLVGFLLVLFTFGCGGGGGSAISTNTTNNPKAYQPLVPQVDQNYNVNRYFLGIVSANGVEMFAFADVESSGKAPYKVTVYIQTSGAPTGAKLDCDWGDNLEPIKDQPLDINGKAELVHLYQIEGVFSIKITLKIPNSEPLVLTSSNITIESEFKQLKILDIKHAKSKDTTQPREELFFADFTIGKPPYTYNWKFTSGKYANQTSTQSNPIFKIDLSVGTWECEVTITDSLNQTATASKAGTGPWKPVITETTPQKAETGANLKISGFQFGTNPGTVMINGPSGKDIVPYSTVIWTENEISFKIDKPLVAGGHTITVYTNHTKPLEIPEDNRTYPFDITCVNPLTVDIDLAENDKELNRQFTATALTTGGEGNVTYLWNIKYYQYVNDSPAPQNDKPETKEHKFQALVSHPISLSVTATDALGVQATKTIDTPILTPYLAFPTPNVFDALSEVTLTGFFFADNESEITVELGNEAKNRDYTSVGNLISYTKTEIKFKLPANALSGNLRVVRKNNGKDLISLARPIIVKPTAPDQPNGTQL